MAVENFLRRFVQEEVQRKVRIEHTIQKYSEMASMARERIIDQTSLVNRLEQNQ